MYCWSIPAVQSNFEELARKLWENPPNKLLLGMPTVTNRVEFCFLKKMVEKLCENVVTYDPCSCMLHKSQENHMEKDVILH